jgi:lycopene cyclase-like protein
VAVVGAGPAGLALAAALAAQGLRVAACGPDAPWAPTYGCWEDELPAAVAAAPGVVRARYADPAFISATGASRDLGRPYLRLDTGALQAHLEDQAAAAGCARSTAPLAALEGGPGAWALSGPGLALTAALVIDATGAGLPGLRRGAGPPPAIQAAWGRVYRLPAGHPFGRMALMDWRPAAAEADAEIGDPLADPSFLYALPLDDERVFLEETSLARRPALPLPQLEARLRRRLAGTGAVASGHVERCLIPMGGPRPLRDQPLLAFGAAAGLVHPATGYQLSRSLQLAGPLATALADALGRDPATAPAAGWAQLWPRGRQRAWGLFDYGLEVLLGLDRTGLDQFFSLFFGLPEAEWRTFLAGDPAPEALRVAMLRLFARADGPTRLALLGRGNAARWGPMLQAALG